MNQQKYSPSIRNILVLAITLLGFAFQDTAKSNPKQTVKSSAHSHLNPTRDFGRGVASWYDGIGGGYTAAHKTLPLGSKVKVTNLYNGRWVLVRINDRGPFVQGRLIDLSPSAAQAIGIYNSGLGKVQLQLVPEQS
jgi:rare lipoprotein A